MNCRSLSYLPYADLIASTLSTVKSWPLTSLSDEIIETRYWVRINIGLVGLTMTKVSNKSNFRMFRIFLLNDFVWWSTMEPSRCFGELADTIRDQET